MTRPENERNLKETGNKIDRVFGDSEFFGNLIEREWLTTQQAATLLGVSENALRIMVYRGQIRAHKFGRRLRFSRRDCQALFQWKGA